MAPQSEFHVQRITCIRLIIPSTVFKFGEDVVRCCHVIYLQIDWNTLLFLWLHALQHSLKDVRYFTIIHFFMFFKKQKTKKSHQNKILKQNIKLREENLVQNGWRWKFDKHKCKYGDHIWVIKSTLSFFVTKRKRETWLVMRCTLFNRSNHHYFRRSAFPGSEGRLRIYLIHCLNPRLINYFLEKWINGWMKSMFAFSNK